MLEKHSFLNCLLLRQLVTLLSFKFITLILRDGQDSSNFVAQLPVHLVEQFTKAQISEEHMSSHPPSLTINLGT